MEVSELLSNNNPLGKWSNSIIKNMLSFKY